MKHPRERTICWEVLVWRALNLPWSFAWDMTLWEMRRRIGVNDCERWAQLRQLGWYRRFTVPCGAWSRRYFVARNENKRLRSGHLFSPELTRNKSGSREATAFAKRMAFMSEEGKQSRQEEDVKMRVTVETQRMVLRPMVPEDYEEAFQWCGDPKYCSVSS